MRNVFLGIIIAFVLLFFVRYCEHQKDERERLEESTAIIQKQLKNVGKLIVTEGTYSQVFSYNDTEKLFGLIDANKKALIVMNAEATISYDLSAIEASVDEAAKTVTIHSIPDPELKINPNIEYYDVTQDYFNPFEAKDYNNIKQQVDAMLREKIKASDLQTNAKNRLISELQKIYILTNSMGWTLQYNETPITTADEFLQVKL